ncbi:MAG TPA: ATP-binding cassette domain-containing protein [Bacteroidia bacterium]|jgi:phospholipid/cholesterol/gamma-HCH transport system ATP-binding protein
METIANRPGEHVIEVQHLQKAFGQQQVLKNISLHVCKGENLVVLGRSGTGKSVLIKCLVRLLEPDEGEMKMLDEDVSAMDDDKLNKLRKKIGFLFQGAALYDSMSVRENLLFPMRDSKDISRKEKEERVKEALEHVGLASAIDKMPAELSGGMRKRIGLARSVILKPRIMFYDEPTAGLDTITAREINKLILDMQQQYKTSSILITHDIECARMTANRMLVINEGQCVAEGSFEELQRSEDKWVRSFFE